LSGYVIQLLLDKSESDRIINHRANPVDVAT
jgi:hypothetical protein